MVTTVNNLVLPEFRTIVRDELHRFRAIAKGRRLRSRVEFAEQVIVLPEGPHQGEHWRRHFQPYAFHILDAMDSLGFRKFRVTGCVQSGKTFNVVILNTVWHLFERRETVVFGVPEMDTARDKWQEELLPAIEASPELRQYLPSGGGGSRGGTPTAIKFRNGATLRFMGATGGDHRRSHFTAPVVVKTEVDRFDTAGESSREAPPVEQMEARTEAFGDQAFSYEECTVTTENGRIWTELQRGTNTKIAVMCVHCRQPFVPSRDDLVGIEDCENVFEAQQQGAFKCGRCAALFSERDRKAMLRWERMLLVHKGQEMVAQDNGTAVAVGAMPRTDTLSLSWNAFHNNFWSTEKIVRDEWKALYSDDPDEADLKRRQFAWALPAEPDEYTLSPLTIADIVARFESGLARGVVPPQTTCLTAGVDCGKELLHYTVRAWTRDDNGRVRGYAIDFGEWPVNSAELGEREGLLHALQDLHANRIAKGYQDAQGERYAVGWTLIDGGWLSPVVWAFMLWCQENNIRGQMMVLGRGQSEPPGQGSYVHPQRVDHKKTLWIGEECHVRRNDKYGLPYMLANSDHWKSFLRSGLSCDREANGALLHFEPGPEDERKLALKRGKHLRAEHVDRRIVPRRGPVDVWVNDSRSPNHFLDADYYSCVAGNLSDVRVVAREKRSPQIVPVRQRPATGEFPQLIINRKD